MIDAAPLQCTAYDLPQWRAFLATIAERPEEDFPRLLAARWLYDQGECSRAEFIETQIDLAKIDKEWDDAGHAQRPDGFIHVAKLRERERALFATHGAEWFYRDDYPAKIIVSGVVTSPPTITIARGFEYQYTVATLRAWVGQHCSRCSGEGCSAHSIATNGPCIDTVDGIGPAVMRQAPTVRAVGCGGKRPYEYRIADGLTWAWFYSDSPRDDNSNVLPKVIWDLLECPIGMIVGHWKHYPTAARAADALSDALRAHAMVGQPKEAVAT